MARTLVLGDLHGGYKALEQVFERSSYSPGRNGDNLILLGDLVDGWPETKRCIDMLCALPNVTFVRGNHDQWFMDYMTKGLRFERETSWPAIWLQQGGKQTLESYSFDIEKNSDPIIVDQHRDFFRKSVLYYERNGDLFVHGGVPVRGGSLVPPSQCTGFELTWDRDLIGFMRKQWVMNRPHIFSEYKRIFVGHTSLSYYNLDKPTKFGNLWGLDTGGGWEGKLSLMDVDTEEFWQSDKVMKLYPDAPGRHG